MNIRLGVVGPEDSVSQIVDIASTYQNFTAVPITYTHVTEAPALVQEQIGMVDQWLFSGQAPYSICIEANVVSEKAAWFPPLQGSSLLGTFLEALYQSEEKVLSVSLDTISPEYTNWLISEFSLKYLTIDTFFYPGHVAHDTLVHYHKEAYDSGKSTLAFTCIRGVYKALIDLGVPCYRVRPAEPVIRETLARIQDHANYLFYKKAQIAVVGAEVPFSLTERKEITYSYKLKHQELIVRKRLLEYAESLQGSFLEVGNGHFEIYTTRGEIEEQGWPYEIIEDIRQIAKLQLFIGIGYGRTAIAAERHVQMALDYSKQSGNPTIVLVDEEKQVMEAGRGEDPLHYAQMQLSDAATKTAISPAAIARIIAKAKQQNREHFSSSELAQWLQSTERNARRILQELERGGVIEQSGEEQSGKRGRPKRVYRFVTLN